MTRDQGVTAADDARFNRLYEEHHGAVLAYCRRRVGSSEAIDVVAAVFAVAWRRIKNVPAGDMALPWLYGVARRVVSEHFRSLERRRRLKARLAGLSTPFVPDPEHQTVRRAEYHQVGQALATLREGDREVLLLAAWEELSNEAISIVLGCSPTAAAQRLHRAKRRLGKAFRGLENRSFAPGGVEGSRST